MSTYVPVVTDVVPPPQSKVPFVIVIVILVLFLIGYAIWLYVTSRNQTGFFKPYTPILAEGLYYPVPPEQANQVLTPTQADIRAKLIQAALEKARIRGRQL